MASVACKLVSKIEGEALDADIIADARLAITDASGMSPGHLFRDAPSPEGPFKNLKIDGEFLCVRSADDTRELKKILLSAVANRLGKIRDKVRLVAAE